MTTSDSTNTTKWVMSSNGRARTPAASQWKKDAQLLDRQSAAADYAAVKRAQAENMARLTALRLAREAAQALLPPAAVTPAPRKGRKGPAAAQTLGRSPARRS